MKDGTVDFKEGLAIIRAYLCTGSRGWLDNEEDDSPDVRIIKWVRSTKLLYSIKVAISFTLGVS